MKKSYKLYVASVLITLPLLTTEVLGMDYINQEDELNHRNLKKIIETHLEKNTDLDSSKDKDIVVFLGNTGSGKSTLINYLSGKQLEVDDLYNIMLTDPNDSSAMQIGSKGSSVTSLPKCIKVGELWFYDMPGFQDTKGTAYDLANAAFLKKIIENAKSAKLVFVVKASELDAKRGACFKILLSNVRKLIPNKLLENFSSLIITKAISPKHVLPKVIISSISDLAIPNDDLSLVYHWVKNGKIEQMDSSWNGFINDGDRARILNLINAIGSEKITDVNTGVLFPEILFNPYQQKEIRGIFRQELWDLNIANKLGNIPNDFSHLNIEALEKEKQDCPGRFTDEAKLVLQQSLLIKLLHQMCPDLYEKFLEKDLRKYLEPLIEAKQLQIDTEKTKKIEAAKRGKVGGVLLGVGGSLVAAANISPAMTALVPILETATGLLGFEYTITTMVPVGMAGLLTAPVIGPMAIAAAGGLTFYLSNNAAK